MRTLLKILLIKYLVFLLTVSSVYGQSDLRFDRDAPPAMEELAGVKQKYLYNVRYGFLNLGEVEVHVTPDTTYNGVNTFHLRTIMRSNSRIPFVGKRDVHYQSFSAYTDEWPYSFIFWRDDMEAEEFDRYKIIFDRGKEEVHFFEYGEPTDTLALEDPASGGDVIFLFARMFAGTDESYKLPVYIDDDKGYVTAENSPEIEMRSYEAFPEPVEAYFSEGNADIDGPFGFTGRFRAWFATDDLRIPLEAHARIIFGNVKVRLIDYEIYQ